MNEAYFCINKNCIFHKKTIRKRKWFIRFGKYKSNIKGNIQRFRCKKCGKTFSAQTFRLDYYEKKLLNYNDIMSYLSESMSISGISRLLRVSVETISNRIEKFSRQVLVYHEYLKGQITLKEDLVADGFESFVKSQYFPNNIHFLGGKDSQYLYFLNYVLLKRKGRMTEEQKDKRNKLYKDIDYPKGSIKKAFSVVLDEFFKLVKTSDKHIALYTDMKKDYKTVFDNHDLYNDFKNRISHVEISSRKLRDKSNDLYTANYLDRETRKDQANHRRETTCHARNVCSCLNRLVVYFFHHNYIKDYRIKNKDYIGISHAEVAGLPKNIIKKVFNKIFENRVFLSLENVKSFALDLWNKKLITPLKGKTDYIPEYAFM
jgi:transposase-like protein